MSLRLKVAENQLEPLEVRFAIQMRRVSTTMQKQCLCHQRPVLLASVTFIAARGSTAIKSFCCFNKISVIYYLSVEVRTTSQRTCFCNQRSVLLSSVSLIATPLEIITAIQSHYLFHLRSVLSSRFPVSVTRGQ